MWKQIVWPLTTLALVATAVAPPASAAEFEVASVRPNNSDDHIVTIDVGPGGRFATRGYTLKLLIQQAYSIRGFQIVGGPKWLDTDRWDVSARAPVKADGSTNWKREELNAMLQDLLARRFALKLIRRTKEMPGLALLEAGEHSKVRASAESEESVRREGPAILLKGATFPSFAKMLGGYLGKPVRDETGIKGLYDFRLEWTERADQVSASDGSAAPEPGLSLQTALRDQLGLKLVSRKVSAEIFVIESAAKASPN